MYRSAWLATLVALTPAAELTADELSPRATEGAPSQFETLLDRLAPKLVPWGAPDRSEGLHEEIETIDMPPPLLFPVAPYVAPELLGTRFDGRQVWFDEPLTEGQFGGLLPLAAEGPSAKDIVREVKGMVAPSDLAPWNYRLDLIATPPPDRPLRLDGIDWPGPARRLPQRK